MINRKVLKENLSDYLFNQFLQSWPQDVNRDNARQGVGKNKRIKHLKMSITQKII